MHDRVCNLAGKYEKKTINILGMYHPPPKQQLRNAIFLDESLKSSPQGCPTWKMQ